MLTHMAMPAAHGVFVFDTQGLNYRDPSVFDMYALDTTTLTLTLDTINPGAVNNWLMDYDFNIRVGLGLN